MRNGLRLFSRWAGHTNQVTAQLPRTLAASTRHMASRALSSEQKSLSWEACLAIDPASNAAVLPADAAVSNLKRRSSKLFQQCRSNNQLALAVLDFSGTVTDPYVMAPADAFVEAFKQYGVAITMSAARRPMGLRKDLHIKALLKDSEVIVAFEKAKGRKPDVEKDGDAIFTLFIPAQEKVLAKYNYVLPGAINAVSYMRQQGMKVGATTGFQRQFVDVLESGLQQQGLEFDVTVAGDDISSGVRPGPHMVYKNMDLTGTNNPDTVVKFDDTELGCGEAVSARTWGVGLYNFANAVGVNSLGEYANLLANNPSELAERREAAQRILQDTGVHYVVGGMHQVPAVLDDIARRLKLGQTPEVCLGLARETPLEQSVRPGI